MINLLDRFEAAYPFVLVPPIEVPATMGFCVEALQVQYGWFVLAGEGIVNQDAAIFRQNFRASSVNVICARMTSGNEYDQAGDPLVAGDFESITCDVVVDGETIETITLTPESVILDELSPVWTRDRVGYNFRWYAPARLFTLEHGVISLVIRSTLTDGNPRCCTLQGPVLGITTS